MNGYYIEKDVKDLKLRVEQLEKLLSVNAIPKTISINGHQVPEPMREKPEIGTNYFISSPYERDWFEESTWDNCAVDNRLLERGLCHSTKEAALAHAKALFSFSEVG